MPTATGEGARATQHLPSWFPRPQEVPAIGGCSHSCDGCTTQLYRWNAIQKGKWLLLTLRHRKRNGGEGPPQAYVMNFKGTGLLWYLRRGTQKVGTPPASDRLNTTATTTLP